jgi:hypothetical protein
MTEFSQPPPRRAGITPLSREMIKDHLERNDLKFMIDQDGDFRVDFAAFADGAPETTVWITIEGANEDIFVIRVIGQKAVAKTMWPQLVAACNQWNMEKRYPKAFLFIPSDTSELFGQIHLEGQFPLAAGVTQPQLDEFISTVIGTGFSFWQWLTDTGALNEDSGDEPTAND